MDMVLTKLVPDSEPAACRTSFSGRTLRWLWGNLSPLFIVASGFCSSDVMSKSDQSEKPTPQILFLFLALWPMTWGQEKLKQRLLKIINKERRIRSSLLCSPSVDLFAQTKCSNLFLKFWHHQESEIIFDQPDIKKCLSLSSQPSVTLLELNNKQNVWFSYRLTKNNFLGTKI